MGASAFGAYVASFAVFGSAAPPIRDPQASFFAIQIAAVALVVACVRALRRRSQPAIPRVEFEFTIRAVLAGIAFVAVTCAQLISVGEFPDVSRAGGAALLGLLEAGAIVGGFALFGRFLGVRA